jgi:hypothetical protein
MECIEGKTACIGSDCDGRVSFRIGGHKTGTQKDDLGGDELNRHRLYPISVRKVAIEELSNHFVRLTRIP